MKRKITHQILSIPIMVYAVPNAVGSGTNVNIHLVTLFANYVTTKKYQTSD